MKVLQLLTSRKKLLLWAMVFLFPCTLFAAEAPKPSSLDNPLAMVLLIIIIVLALVIGLLGYVVVGAAGYFSKKNNTAARGAATKAALSLLVLFFSASAFAQDAAPAVKDRSVSGLDSTTFFMLMSVIAIEVIIIFSLLYFLQRFIAKENLKLVAETTGEPVVKESRLKIWWEKVNSFRSMKEEAAITFDHSYDGIHELDNRLPPWWLYGFYLTILVGAIYLWRFHVSHTAPSSLEEYTAAVKKAEVEKEAYLAKAANQVDENTVVMLDAAGIGSGKAIFVTNCAPCHGANGAGAVGPNLTDDYWLHGGGLKDIFKTIKYGVQEKGMKSWKEDFSPIQLAQLASFVKSIHGNKVDNPKEPQGDLYKEEQASDSTAKAVTIKDSAVNAAPVKP